MEAEPKAVPQLTPDAPPADRWLAAPLLLGAAVILGSALQLANGAFNLEAIRLVTWALALAVLALVLPRMKVTERWGELALAVVALGGVAYQFGKLLTLPPGIYLRLSGPMTFAPFFVGLALAAVLAGSLLSMDRWAQVVRLPLLVATFLYLGVWLIQTSPSPFIDVYVFQRDGVLELLSGRNPYAMTYPDIYGDQGVFYGPGLAANGRLTFGFPYPPVSLFLAIPGQVLLGDYRYSQLVLMAASGALIAQARPGRSGALAAAVLLFTPRSFFVLEQGWTEPYVVFLLCLVVFVAVRYPKAVPYALGLFVASKQYLVFAVPLAFLLYPRPWSGVRALGVWVGKAVVVGAVLTLPLALWDFGAFWKDVVALQVYQPFRADALSYLAWAAQGGSPLPTALAFVGALAMVGLGLWRAPRTPAGFALAVALAFFVFFAFNKQAFCNYYYFVVGALCCAAGTMQPKA